MILLITEIWKRWKSKNERQDLRDNSQWIPQILIAKRHLAHSGILPRM